MDQLISIPPLLCVVFSQWVLIFSYKSVIRSHTYTATVYSNEFLPSEQKQIRSQQKFVLTFKTSCAFLPKQWNEIIHYILAPLAPSRVLLLTDCARLWLRPHCRLKLPTSSISLRKLFFFFYVILHHHMYLFKLYNSFIRRQRRRRDNPPDLRHKNNTRPREKTRNRCMVFMHDSYADGRPSFLAKFF